MTAKQTFENLLSQVQSSCLNFRIELSPFSATIYLKKSFIKNQHSFHVHPQTEPEPAREVRRDDDKARISELEVENNALQEKLQKAAREILTCNEVIDNHKKENKEKQELIENLALANKDLADESKAIGSELYNTKVELTKYFEKENEDNKKYAEVKKENQARKNQVEDMLRSKLETTEMNIKVIEEKET